MPAVRCRPSLKLYAACRAREQMLLQHRAGRSKRTKLQGRFAPSLRPVQRSGLVFPPPYRRPCVAARDDPGVITRVRPVGATDGARLPGARSEGPARHGSSLVVRGTCICGANREADQLQSLIAQFVNTASIAPNCAMRRGARQAGSTRRRRAGLKRRSTGPGIHSPIGPMVREFFPGR